MELTETQRVQAQTNEEWLQEYETSIKVYPKSAQVPVQEFPFQQVILIFDSHRTTKRGVVLALINTATRQEVDAFFNADTMHRRGKDKGKHKRTGEGGEFLPQKKTKFRKFWINTVGEQPLRWSAIHKEMKSKLRGLQLTGELTVGYREDGSPFNKVENLRLLEQHGNKLGTKLELFCNKHLEQRVA